METGVKIKKYVENEDKNDILVIKELVTYNVADVKQKYIPNLDALIDDGIIEPTKFTDNIWRAIDEFEVSYNLKFNFETQPEVNNALKCYAILKLSEQYSTPSNVYKALNIISKMLLTSNYFNEEYIEDTNIQIKNWNDSDRATIGYIKEFIRFYNLNIPEKYFDIINSIPFVPSKTRDLPCYSSIINFDYLIQDFISKNYLSSKLEFVPIVIWWELTKIIPMRPIEFAILKRDCLSIKNDECFIKIERRKEKGGKVKYKTIKVLTDIKIPFKLYNIIENYIDSTSNIAKGTFIFSCEVYKSLNSRAYKKSELDFIGMSNLRKLLNKFFLEIIGTQYDYEIIAKNEVTELKDFQIEKLQLGDTRHIAFCGMMLQGFNPLTIAQIGGHYTLTEQTSYCSHLDTFVDSHTYMLTKSIRNKMIKNISNDIPINSKISKDKLILKERLGTDFYSLPKVKGGRCTSKNFPNDCTSDNHIYCNYFIPDETLSYELLNTELNMVNQDIENKLHYMKSLTQTLLGASKAKKIESELKTNTNCLNTLIRQKAIIESYRLNMMEESKNE